MIRRRGRPLLVILALLAVLAASMLGVTFSAYVRELNLFGSGWVGPKYFAFEAAAATANQTLAPGASVNYAFTVRNDDGGGVAQVPLHVSIEITYPAQLAGTGAIQAELLRGGAVLASSTGTGTLSAAGATLPAGTATADAYTLRLTWQNADLALLGGMKDTPFDPSSITVRVSGYQ